MTLTGLKRVSTLSALMCAMAVLAGCATEPNPPPPTFPPNDVGAPGGTAAPAGRFSQLGVGDLLMISFSDLGPLTSLREQQVRIPDSGVITLPHNIRVQAAGKTTSELEKDIRNAYVPILYTTLTAIVRTEERSFIVDGEVRQPGQKPYLSEMTVLRAIGVAGGFTEFANKKRIQLRRQNGQRFLINWHKAIERNELDLPVYPNDHIIVVKTWF
jgi:polysaccharide export outer membrane protein